MSNPEISMSEEEALELLILALGKEATDELLNQIRGYEDDSMGC